MSTMLVRIICCLRHGMSCGESPTRPTDSAAASVSASSAVLGASHHNQLDQRLDIPGVGSGNCSSPWGQWSGNPLPAHPATQSMVRHHDALIRGCGGTVAILAQQLAQSSAVQPGQPLFAPEYLHDGIGTLAHWLPAGNVP